MNKTIIISGYPPGDSGVGRLVEYLIEMNNDDFLIITVNIDFENPYTNIFVKYFFKIIYKIFKVFHKIFIRVKLKFLKNEKIIIIHPQTIGFKTTIKLLKNNKIFYYVVDCSFFCVKSYNHLENENTSCLRCLNSGFDSIKENRCNSFPVENNRSSLNFLKKLKEHKNQIHFLLQNMNQKKLLKKYFGDVKCTVIGLKTSDMKTETERVETLSGEGFDFVFHADPHPAKGLIFLLNLSKYLKEYSILIPSCIKKINKILNTNYKKEDFSNIIFNQMRWDSGLKEKVKKAKIVLHPTLWATPIEGALIKSLIYNGVVATFDLSFSYPNEISDTVLIKLDNNSIKKSSIILKETIKDKEKLMKYKKNSQKWLQKFFKYNNMYEKLKRVTIYR